jgi:hypothetical protein
VVAGEPGVVDGAGGLADGRGLPEVDGELVEPLAVARDLLQGQAHVAVHPASAAGGQVLIDAGADQGVGEPVAVGVHGHRPDQLRVLCRLQRPDHDGHAAFDHGRERPHVELLADHRRRAQHLLDVLGEPAEPLQDDLPDSFGDRQATGRPAPRHLRQRPGLAQVHQHLLDAERVAVGLGVQVPGELALVVVQLPIDGGGDHRRHAVGVEPGQRQPLAPAGPAQIGQQLGQLVVPADVGVAVGADDEQPHRLVRAGQVP